MGVSVAAAACSMLLECYRGPRGLSSTIVRIPVVDVVYCMTMDADRLLSRLGRRVRTLRGDPALTLRDLAARSGISERFLVQVEAGAANISVRKLAGLAHALGTSPAELLGGGPGG